MPRLNKCVDHDFAMWAFGETWIDYLTWDADNMDLVYAWNQRHADKMTINPEDIIIQSMAKMKQIWSEDGQKNAQSNPQDEAS